jgi:hypothetical protein
VNITCFAPFILNDNWANKSQSTDFGGIRFLHTGTVVLTFFSSNSVHIFFYNSVEPVSIQFSDNINQSIVELPPGDSVTLKCDVTGRPTPNISWELPQNDVPVQYEQSNRNLLINDAKSFHEGAYKCTATNSLESATKVFQVAVQGIFI